jgi:hypothetical protein
MEVFELRGFDVADLIIFCSLYPLSNIYFLVFYTKDVTFYFINYL